MLFIINKEPDRFGIEEQTPNNYLGQLIEPLLPQGAWNKLEKKIK